MAQSEWNVVKYLGKKQQQTNTYSIQSLDRRRKIYPPVCILKNTHTDRMNEYLMNFN